MSVVDRTRSADDFAVASRPSTSMALVPLRRAPDTEPAPAARARKGPARVCYAVGYAALAAFLLAALLGTSLGEAAFAIYVPAGVLLALSGLGAFVFTIIQRDEPAVRRMLAAIASLVAMIALHGPISHLGRHVYVSSKIAGAETVVHEVLRTPGIISLEFGDSGWMDLNGYSGFRDGSTGFAGPPQSGLHVPHFAALLRQEGVSPADFQRIEDAGRAAGVNSFEVSPDFVALSWDDANGTTVLYSRRGAVPTRGTRVLNRSVYNVRRLGGGWYLNGG